MLLKVTDLYSASKGPSIEASHNEEVLTFSASYYGRIGLTQEGFDVFNQINNFWETLPEKDQREVFELYREIDNIFTHVWTISELSSNLTDVVTRLLDFHDFERMHHWVIFQSDITIPSSIDVSYEDKPNRKGTREQTYLRGEYSKLVTLSLILRLMVPIWGTYIQLTRSEISSDFKEFFAFRLISHSKVYYGEAFAKLTEYVNVTIGDDRFNPSFINKGISSEDFPIWILGLIVVRRLCIGDIRGVDANAHLVTYIYKFILQRMKGGDVSIENIIKEKDFDDGAGDSDTKLSTLERYKIKHAVSQGTVISLHYSVSDLASIAHRLTGKMTDDLLNRSLSTSSQLANHRLMEPNLTLLKLVMKPVISPKGVMYISKHKGWNLMIGLFGVLQAVLYARGHKYLALLSTSYANIGSGEMHISSNVPRDRISKEISAKLDELYPYMKTKGGKKTGIKPVNMATAAIETLADNLTMYSWTMTADEELIREGLGSFTTRKLTIPPNIKNILGELIVELGSRSWD